MEKIKTAAATLRERRTRLGWSAEELAKRARAYAQEAGDPIKLTQQSVSGFEVGKSKRIPRWLHYAELALNDEGTINAARIANRMREAMDERDCSISALAKSVNANREIILSLLRGDNARLDFIPAIATALRVPEEWLRGEPTEVDRDHLFSHHVGSDLSQRSGEAQNKAELSHVMMAVRMPSAAALKSMFEIMLNAFDELPPKAELAQALALRLPVALAQSQGPMRIEPMEEGLAHEEAAPLPSTVRLEHQPRPHI